jgi:adenylyl-sulfate kinase
MTDDAAPAPLGSSAAGWVIWLTGPPCAGKTTLGRLLADDIRRAGARAELLDGDEIRASISPDLGFSEADRNTNVYRIGYIARLLQRNGVMTIVAAVSPYRRVRDELRQSIPNFVEVFVDCSRDERVRRDTKGMYRQALAGDLQNFTGVSAPYEPPTHPDVVVHTDRMSKEECLSVVLDALRARGCGLAAAATRQA